MLYKPHLAERIHGILAANVGPVDVLLACCRHVPPLAPEVVNVCPGCDRRFRENYQDASTISLWELLVEKPLIALPDYGGREMTIIDACPTRGEARVHDAVRELVRRMNISLVEPANTRTKSTCCGDTFWGTVPAERVVSEMKKKAAEMPAEEVVVYCVSCAKAMFVGGRRPRHLIDLLFDEDTVPGTFEPAAWHKELDEYIDSHT
jgi:Fe-S oxidoreductase